LVGRAAPGNQPRGRDPVIRDTMTGVRCLRAQR